MGDSKFKISSSRGSHQIPRTRTLTWKRTVKCSSVASTWGSCILPPSRVRLWVQAEQLNYQHIHNNPHIIRSAVLWVAPTTLFTYQRSRQALTVLPEHLISELDKARFSESYRLRVPRGGGSTLRFPVPRALPPPGLLCSTGFPLPFTSLASFP